MPKKNPEQPGNGKASPARESSKSRKKPAKALPAEVFPIVGIGGSAGGFESVSALLRNLPRDLGMSFVVIQHLANTPKSALAHLLGRMTEMPVVQITDGMKVEMNHVYVLMPNYDVVLQKRRLRLVRRPASERIHMPIDHFFMSLAKEEKDRAIGIVLSGTGTDGTLGLQEIKAENGLTFAESDTSAKYFAMPNSAILAGCVDGVHSPKDLARELAGVSRHPYVRLACTQDDESNLSGFPESADALTKVFFLLKQNTAVNFTDYKHTTLRRRIARRMVLHQVEKLEDYVKLLRKDSSEVEQLFDDLLINVTGFFRDPTAFSTLQKRILPRLIKPKLPHGDIRVWVPGCATGEEVYSVAISIVEALGREGSAVRVQIFGTDLSEQIVTRARAGIFPETISKDVSPARLRRFFTRLPNGSYQISRNIRDMCTFARQNVCEDPPFSRIDLITCRNLLIYLGPQLQKKCIPIFHYSLNAGGYLMLGTSETVGGFADLFALVDKKHKIYSKKITAVRPALDFNSKNFTAVKLDAPKPMVAAPDERDSGNELQRQVDRLILARYSPNGVVADERMQVVQFRGATGRFLEHAPGTATLNLLQLAKPMLVVDLRTALHRAMKENVSVRRENVLLKNNGDSLLVSMEVFPLRVETSGERLFFVTFEDTNLPEPEEGSVAPASISKAQTRIRKAEIERLQDELNSTKESLQAIIEEREAANEELKSANEEIQSSNEELQSTNEELETAKEELQSANEELTTVNEELANRNAELAMVNNDLNNLLSSINIPIIIVDNDLCVRRVTAPGEKAFNLIPSDVGRPLSNIKPNLNMPDLGPLIREVIETLSTREREVCDSNDRWHQLRIRPYRTTDNKIDGAVITLIEIDQMKRSIAELQTVVEFANAILDSARDPMLVVDDELQVKQVNRAFRERFKIAKADVEHSRVHKIGEGWKIPRLRRWLDEIVEKQQRAAVLEVAHKFPLLGMAHLRFRAQRLRANGDHFIVLTVTDIPAQAPRKK